MFRDLEDHYKLDIFKEARDDKLKYEKHDEEMKILDMVERKEEADQNEKTG